MMVKNKVGETSFIIRMNEFFINIEKKAFHYSILEGQENGIVISLIRGYAAEKTYLQVQIFKYELDFFT